MADDWQVGDLALCVNDNPCEVHPGSEGGIKAGRVYTVCKVLQLPNYAGVLCVALVLDRDNVFDPESGRPGAHNAKRFRKIPPHEADAEDRETIALLTGKPAQVPA